VPGQEDDGTPIHSRDNGNCLLTDDKCDGTRPICNTCSDKKRQCYYSEQTSEDPRIETNGIPHQVQAVSSELSELEKMKKELEEAKARIQELETEKRASTTPVQTPQMAPRPHSQPQPPPQPQPHHRHSHSQAQAQVQVQAQVQPQRQVPPQQHRQQLQQLNRSRSIHSPQQMAYKIDTPPQPQRVINAQPSIQTSPSQNMQNATQQLQVAAQQLNTAQPHQQMQPNQNYFATNHTNHSPYGTLNRAMTQPSLSTQSVQQNPMAAQQNPMTAQNPNAITSQNTMSVQTNLPQTQPQATTTPVDATGYNAREEFGWPQAAVYYGYQSAQQQQHAQDQWAAARGNQVYR
jgi:hypothetical protein